MRRRGITDAEERVPRTRYGTRRRVAVAASMTLLLGLAAAVATVPAIAGDTSSSPRPSRLFVDRGHGISLRYVDGWHVSNQRLNGIIDPVQRFVVSSYRIRPASRSTGGADGG